MPARSLRYLALFFSCAAVALLLGSIGWWGGSVLSCPPAPPGAFLAYCRNELYGDFEHGAFFYGLESAALQHAARADAIVVGDSRAQFGFSTGAMRRYFADRRQSYYLLGMGYGSTSPYARALLERYRLKPRVLIVNAEPFFTRETPSVPSAVLRADSRTVFEYWRKWLFQPIHRLACERMPARCQHSPGGIHRRIDNGDWIWDGVLVAGDLAVPFVDRAISQDQQRQAESEARAFVTDLGLDERCVFVTAVPGLSADSRRVVTAIASVISGIAVLPVVQDIASLDGDHLNAASAEKWSAAFLHTADDRLNACLSD
jgi:hypothetical protein